MSDNMSYFGTSGPKSNFAHSIGAGYVRRLNQTQARINSPFGGLGVVIAKENNPPSPGQRLKIATKQTKEDLEDIAIGLRDRANNFYNNRFAVKYKDPNSLVRLVEEWDSYAGDVVRAKLIAKQNAEEAFAALAFKITELNKLSNEIRTELEKSATGRSEEINEMYIADRIIEIESLNLTYANGSKMRWSVKNDKQIRYDLSEQYTVAYEKRKVARQEYDDARITLDRVYQKKVEDWMVDGPLMRESKAALIVSPLMLFLGFGAAYMLLNPRQTRVSGSKSAAFAVFN